MTQMNNNFLDYTKLTYSDIIQQITDKINQDSRFENFRESAIAQLMLEIFSGVTDFTNYYIERRSEEVAGFDTAKLRSSIILLSRQLGYIIRRPVPSESSVSVEIKGGIPSGAIAEGDKVYLTKYETSFNYEGNPFVLKKTYTYEFTADDVANLLNPTYSKIIDGSYIDDGSLILNEQGNVPSSSILPIEILQGEITTTSFVSNGSILQTFELLDSNFSNIFGETDYSYDSDTGEFSLENGITKIGVGDDLITSLYDENLYRIDRRSLLTSEYVLNSSIQGETKKVCYIRTRIDDGIDVVFGDGNVSKIPENGKVIGVQYLNTIGAKSNKIGVIGKQITCNDIILTDKGYNITSKLVFRLTSNIKGGANIEDVESIKLNAPAIYYSLDRLVTKSDYNTFLRTLVNPFQINNSIVWGEHEEIQSRNNTRAISELCNVILWSVLGSLYNKPLNGSYQAKVFNGVGNLSLENSIIEGSDYHTASSQNIIDYGIYYPTTVSRAYNNLYTKKDTSGVLKQLSYQESLPYGNNFNIIDRQLKNKQQITIRSVYIPPVIQEFDLIGDININKLSNLTKVKQAINNAVYDYLDLNADFNKKLYLSNLIEIIDSFKEVINCNIEFYAKQSNFSRITDFDYRTTFSNIPVGTIETLPELSTYSSIDRNIIATKIKSNVVDYIYNTKAYSENGYNWIDQKRIHFAHEFKYFARANITERDFYFTALGNLWTELNSLGYSWFLNSDNFLSIVNKLNNEYKLIFRNSMIDIDGNITNFSLSTEVPLININTTYNYYTN